MRLSPQPNVNIEWNSDELNAFLESLLHKGYVFDTLTDDNSNFYVISRREDNKLWLISEKWWFNGEKFWKDEYWFDGIDTQETQEDTIIEFRIWNIWVICKLDNDNNITLCDWNEDAVVIGDMITSVLTKKSNRLN